MVLTLLACQAVEPEHIDSAGGGLMFRGFIELPGAMDVTGQGDIAVLAGGENPLVDVLIADVSEPSEPLTLATIEGLDETRDVHLEGDVLYTAHDTGSISVRIWDLSDPSDPTLLSVVEQDRRAHNLHVGGGHLYVANREEKRVGIYDVSDPSDPAYVGGWSPPVGGVHDQTWAEDRLYVTGHFGFAVLDVSDPGSAQTLYEWLAPGPQDYVHSLWPAQGGRYVLTTHEVLGAGLRVFDLEAGPAEVTRWPEVDSNCAHNVVVRGDQAFVAWFIEGLKVVDISDPTAPEGIGAYDTWEPARVEDPGSCDLSGAFGVWPLDERILLGDESGLWIFELEPE